MRSSDRIYRIFVMAGALWSTGADLDVGVALAGVNHDGATLDVNLFGDALDIGGGLAFSGIGFAGSNLVDEDRGEPIWYLVDQGTDQGWTEDPKLDFDILFTFTTTLTTADDVNIWINYAAR